MILGLLTVSSDTELWLFDQSPSADAVAHVEWESGRKLSTELLSRIVDLLKTNDQELKALTGIIIFSGPGSFTSLRIGHTIANALADSLSIPVMSESGDDWLKTARVEILKAKAGIPVLPSYGAEPNITRRLS